MSDLLTRITVEDGKCGGRPCIRGLRMRVVDILDMMDSGEGAASILAHHPDLEPDDLRACLAYAARQMSHAVLVSAA